MKKGSSYWHRMLGVATALLLGISPLCSTPIFAAGKTVLVLPFHVEAGPEVPNAVNTVPQSILDKFKAQGFTAIPLDRAKGLFRASGLHSIDLAGAKKLGNQAGADLVVYGVFNQVGKGFKMETRLVPVKAGKAVPANLEKDSIAKLSDAAEQIVSRGNSVLHAIELSPAPLPSTPTPQAPRSAAEQIVPMNVPVSGGLADVKIRGIQNMDSDVVLMRMTIRKGDKPDAAALNEEVKRIWEMGYFTDVQAHMEGNVLVFDVVEKPRIEHIVIEGADKVSSEDVLAAMSTRTGNVLNEQTLAEDLKKISELYNKEGYYLAKPTYRIDKRSNGKGASLVITVDEGKKLYITEVRVDGLKQMKQSDMSKYMAMSDP